MDTRDVILLTENSTFSPSYSNRVFVSCKPYILGWNKTIHKIWSLWGYQNSSWNSSSFLNNVYSYEWYRWCFKAIKYN